MPDRSPLELAKQGDPQAIAAVINHSLKAKAISADVFREDNSLHIMLEGDSVPANQRQLVNYLRNGLTNLQIPSIYTAKVYGRQLGDDPAWEEEIVLKMPPPDEVEPDEGVVIADSSEYDEDLDIEDAIADDEDDDLIDADDEDLVIDDHIDEDEDEEEEGDDYYNPEEDDDPEDDDETEQIESEKPKSKLIWLIPLLLILAIAALVGLHFGGILTLPFLPGGGTSESEPVAPTPEETAPTETSPEAGEAPASAPAEETPAEAADPWREGVNAAMSAAESAQTAQTQAEWNAVASQWQRASELMGQVPESSPNYQAAQERVQTYAQNQQIAEQRAADAPN
ncbi:hypothetical protein [Lyngbya sp. CCY1209]|uniref:hypothetical protein n=1 Tax=Lyngbya sp. CCY1209 TaxID=2886103 RepID=UPI002D20FC09|nr:hypothetical protein [Lyngbya sp. CCY1209]MEB3883888.1 hypothetical protein [Lyngbya sp. CCY1209]